MATATLTDGPAVQLTFPWALPKAGEDSTIVAERRSQSAAGRRPRVTGQSRTTVVARVTVERHRTASPVAKAQTSVAAQPSATALPSVTASGVTVSPLVSLAAATPISAPAAVAGAAAAAVGAECAHSVQEALCGDRIGKPVRVGAVMFRLLKRYGITDEEIAEGVAAYTAKRNAAACA